MQTAKVINSMNEQQQVDKFLKLSLNQIALILLDGINDYAVIETGNVVRADETQDGYQTWVFKELMYIINNHCTDAETIRDISLEMLERNGTIILDDGYVKSWYSKVLFVDSDTWDQLLDYVINYLTVVLS